MTQDIAPAPHRRITELELCRWLGMAEPGEAIEYHRGFLAIDAYAAPALVAERRALVALARRALWAQEAGVALLVQRRLGPSRFSYLAVKRRATAGSRRAAEALPEVAA